MSLASAMEMSFMEKEESLSPFLEMFLGTDNAATTEQSVANIKDNNETDGNEEDQRSMSLSSNDLSSAPHCVARFPATASYCKEMSSHIGPDYVGTVFRPTMDSPTPGDVETTMRYNYPSYKAAAFSPLGLGPKASDLANLDEKRKREIAEKEIENIATVDDVMRIFWSKYYQDRFCKLKTYEWREDEKELRKWAINFQKGEKSAIEIHDTCTYGLSLLLGIFRVWEREGSPSMFEDKIKSEFQGRRIASILSACLPVIKAIAGVDAFGENNVHNMEMDKSANDYKIEENDGYYLSTGEYRCVTPKAYDCLRMLYNHFKSDDHPLHKLLESEMTMEKTSLIDMPRTESKQEATVSCHSKPVIETDPNWELKAAIRACTSMHDVLHVFDGRHYKQHYEVVRIFWKEKASQWDQNLKQWAIDLRDPDKNKGARDLNISRRLVLGLLFKMCDLCRDSKMISKDEIRERFGVKLVLSILEVCISLDKASAHYTMRDNSGHLGMDWYDKSSKIQMEDLRRKSGQTRTGGQMLNRRVRWLYELLGLESNQILRGLMEPCRTPLAS